MKFQEFERLIQIKFIDGLLKPFPARIVHRREYKGQYYPGFEIGIIVDVCKFQFAWEESGGVLIGSLDSAFADNHSGWFSLERLICFLTHQPFTWKSPFEKLPRDEKIVATFHNLGKISAPHVSKLITMFSSQSNMAEWTEKYNEYEDEQFKLRYPSFYEEYMRRKYS